ncbi:MAG TPA: helix-turn-helix domain-containing protein [Vicinamibacterales bacterium]|nr:helix-turn-helix domain-containing protein [Vicinamibacterales bacterium]
MRVVKDELANEGHPLVGGSMSLARDERDECTDDRRPLLNSPGTALRRAREGRGLTIEDLARTTKISRTMLTAIESGDVRHLPAAIYTRGFVKAYAQEVGLNPDQAADEYLEHIAPATAPHLRDSGPLPPLAHSADATVDANDDVRHVLAANQLRRVGWLTPALAAVGLIVYLTSFVDRESRPASPAAVTSEAADRDARQANQIAPGASAITADAARAAEGSLRVELTTQGLCWVVLSVDGVPVLRRLLQPGERHTFDVAEEMVMRVGDPGALTLSINGQPAQPLGTAGEPVDVRITKANFRQFLRS